MGSCFLHLPLEEYCMETFSLEKAVCNHGFFMMAPNSWIPSTKTLQRPLRLANSTTSVNVSISHPPDNTSIVIQVHDVENVSPEDEKVILEQVSRMLRVSLRDKKNLMAFQKVYPEAEKKDFGRIFRSPTLFEDAIKSILLCNCMWKRTLDMAKALCVLQSELANGLISKQYCCENLAEEPSKKRRLKRKKATQKQSNKLIDKNPENCSDSQDRAMGNFPSSKEIACLDESFLKRHCNLGYRAENIVRLARDVESGKVKLEEVFESETIDKEMMKIKGFGPFACATLMMCVGFYQVVPVDSETVRHLEECHGRKVPDKVGMRKKLEIVQQHVKDIYEKYAPFQSLAYWYASFNLQNNAFFHHRSLIIITRFEVLECYERQFGKLSELPNSSYHVVTGSH